MADFTPSIVFSLTQSPISQSHTVPNKTKKSPVAKSPPTPLPNVVTLHHNSKQPYILSPLVRGTRAKLGGGLFIPNFCDKQEQRSLLQLTSEAKIKSKANNS